MVETWWCRQGGGDRVVRHGGVYRVVKIGWWRQGRGDRVVETR